MTIDHFLTRRPMEFQRTACISDPSMGKSVWCWKHWAIPSPYIAHTICAMVNSCMDMSSLDDLNTDRFNRYAAFMKRLRKNRAHAGGWLQFVIRSSCLHVLEFHVVLVFGTRHQSLGPEIVDIDSARTPTTVGLYTHIGGSSIHLDHFRSICPF